MDGLCHVLIARPRALYVLLLWWSSFRCMWWWGEICLKQKQNITKNAHAPVTQAIKGAGSSDAEREAVREAVRSQRRKISRSASHETPRIANQLSPTPENPMEEGIAAGSGDYNSSGKGSSKDHGRSRSMSPGRARIPGHLQQQQLQQQQLQQSVSGYGSPRMEPLTSGSSASMSIDHSSSTESGALVVGYEIMLVSIWLLLVQQRHVSCSVCW